MKEETLQRHYEGFRFPKCFFEFYELVSELKQEYGIHINRCSLNIVPGEVFGILGDNPENADPWEASRYPNDPPEFFTLLHGQSDGLHWGYYIENENAPEILVVSYFHRDPLFFSIDGLNLHEALRGHLEVCWRDYEDYLQLEKDPIYRQQLDELSIIRDVIKKYYTADREETGSAYLEKYSFVARPGIPLRYGIDMQEDKTEYRPIENAGNFMNPGFVPDNVQVLQAKKQALDLLNEGFPLAALKLGRDLWCYENQRAEAVALLKAAYPVLNRPRALAFLEKIERLNS